MCHFARRGGIWMARRLQWLLGQNIVCINSLEGIEAYGYRRLAPGKQHAIDAQRAPVHSSSYGALLRLYEAICDVADSKGGITDTWPSRALSRNDTPIVGNGVSAWHLKLSRHRDPAPTGVCHTVSVESWLLHCSGTDEFSKESALSASDRLL
jgi:hypothetical protein